MAIRKIYLEQYADAIKQDPDHWNGKSPGWVASHFNITRQAVNYAYRHDLLDAVYILDEEMHRLAIIITNESIQKYAERKHAQA